MTAISTQLVDDSNRQTDATQPAIEPKRQAITRRKVAETPAVAVKDAAMRAAAFPVPQAGISRHIDWYVKSRGLPPLIVDFLDTHWRSYTLRCFLKDGGESESCREAVNAMKDLAWSVRRKKESLSRRRLVALIPQLYQQLHVGLESLGLGIGATERDAFFAELAKLHQAALDPQMPVAEVPQSGTK